MDTAPTLFGTSSQPASSPSCNRLVAALRLADEGHLEEAEAILLEMGRDGLTKQGLDLLARIEVRKGALPRARYLWQEALRLDPSYAPARRALWRLETRWVAAGVARRILWLVAIGAAVSFSATGVLFLLSGPPYFISTGGQQMLASVSRLERPKRDATASEAVGSRTVGATLPAAASIPSLNRAPTDGHAQQKGVHLTFTVPGFTVRLEGDELTATPVEGLFQYRCELDEAARSRIAVLADALRPLVPTHSVVLEGHTDSDPPPANSPYKDNYDLGIHRALVVADVLREEHGIPAERLQLSSVGAANLLFAEDSASSKCKNRTVLIRVIPTR